MKRQSVHFLSNEPQITKRYNSAVSLHSHTDRSREGFTGIEHYSEDSILIRLVVEKISARYRKLVGRDLDYDRAYFLPPLTPRDAYRLEATQIQTLGMNPMVSLTDHDTIEGVQQLHAFANPETAPISLEWTVPYGCSYFHVGVHNLPFDRAAEIVKGLSEVQCSYCKQFQLSCVGGHGAQCFPRVHEWFEELAAIPGVLLVLNHPLWDVSRIGESAHAALLNFFLSRYGAWIHALELNGLRSWQENLDVMAIAEKREIPLVSGGDRHGKEPNAVLNLTDAGTFSEFVEELRLGATSEVVFLRQYEKPLLFRKLRVAWDVAKTSDNGSESRMRWNDRVFLPWVDGRVLPLSSYEWLSTLSNEPIEGPQPVECLPGDVMQGAE